MSASPAPVPYYDEIIQIAAGALALRAGARWEFTALHLTSELHNAKMLSLGIPSLKPGNGCKLPMDASPTLKNPESFTIHLRAKFRQGVKDLLKWMPPHTRQPGPWPTAGIVTSDLGDLELIFAWEVDGLKSSGQSLGSPILASALNQAACRVWHAIPMIDDPAKFAEIAMRLVRLRLTFPVPLAPKAMALLRSGADHPHL